MSYKVTFQQYQDGLAEGRFLGLRCPNCGEFTFPPKGLCENCGGRDCDVVELKGKGTVRTFTVIRVAPEGRKPPYIVAMTELDEGPWVMGILDGFDPDQADMSLLGRTVTLSSRVVEGDVYSDDCRCLTFQVDA